MGRKKYINWSKCIHIHACRRFSKLVELKTGQKISRGCGKNCKAYEEFKAEELLEKCCEWLDDNADGYCRTEYIDEIDDYPRAWVSDLLTEDFKESMIKEIEQ